eukprot:CAMPEP_0201581950 /NCGR_PEP_ID=MMETSP0190_2-20130828/77766_1 /ASSEMBLY_ACC=CAM_ASM_000263 /TAXON_ID=37353 /ORGANISM="Rosalina sp." /LENGTH=189 /DNA_ID=CAMNT_0048020931 /DNA_START=37 /DNA_END=606 /DNA_ORIENTATION=-
MKHSSITATVFVFIISLTAAIDSEGSCESKNVRDDMGYFKICTYCHETALGDSAKCTAATLKADPTEGSFKVYSGNFKHGGSGCIATGTIKRNGRIVGCQKHDPTRKFANNKKMPVPQKQILSEAMPPHKDNQARDEYDNLLIEYEYDYETEQAREEKAVRLLEKERERIEKLAASLPRIKHKRHHHQY